MKQTRFFFILTFLSFTLTSQFAFASADQSEKKFCEVKEFFANNKPFTYTTNAITTAVTLFGGTLAALIDIEAQRAKLKKGLDTSKVSLRAISVVGPLKAFGKAAIPFMDKTAKVIDSVKLDSKTATIYKKVYTPMSYAWSAITTGLYGVQTAGVFVCGKGTLLATTIRKKQVKSTSDKFVKLAKKYGNTISSAVKRCTELKNLTKPFSKSASSITKTLKPVKSTIAGLKKGLTAFNKAFSPVFTVTKKLVSEMKKKRCITYGVKVKVKVKVKSFKIWKWKWKTKVKQVKFCFVFSKVMDQINKIAKLAQKPVKDLFNKIIKPLMKKIMSAVKKALKLDKLLSLQKKMAGFGKTISKLGSKLGAKKAMFSSDLTKLKRLSKEISRLR